MSQSLLFIIVGTGEMFGSVQVSPTAVVVPVSHLCVIRPLLILAYLNLLPPPSSPGMTSVTESGVVLLSYLLSLLVLGCICMNSDLNSDLFASLDLEIKV